MSTESPGGPAAVPRTWSPPADPLWARTDRGPRDVAPEYRLPHAFDHDTTPGTPPPPSSGSASTADPLVQVVPLQQALLRRVSHPSGKRRSAGTLPVGLDPALLRRPQARAHPFVTPKRQPTPQRSARETPIVDFHSADHDAHLFQYTPPRDQASVTSAEVTGGELFSPAQTRGQPLVGSGMGGVDSALLEELDGDGPSMETPSPKQARRCSATPSKMLTASPMPSVQARPPTAEPVWKQEEGEAGEEPAVSGMLLAVSPSPVRPMRAVPDTPTHVVDTPGSGCAGCAFLRKENVGLRREQSERGWAVERAVELGAALSDRAEDLAALHQEIAVLRAEKKQLAADLESSRTSEAAMRAQWDRLLAGGPLGCGACLARDEAAARKDCASAEEAERWALECTFQGMHRARTFVAAQLPEVEAECMAREDIRSHMAELERAKRVLIATGRKLQQAERWREKHRELKDAGRLYVEELTALHNEDLQYAYTEGRRTAPNAALAEWAVARLGQGHVQSQQALTCSTLVRKQLWLLRAQLQALRGSVQADVAAMSEDVATIVRNSGPLRWHTVRRETLPRGASASPRRVHIPRPPKR